MNETKLLTQPQAGGKRCHTRKVQPLPPIETIVAKGRGEVPIYGIYCWGIDYEQFRSAIRGIGFRNIRTGGTGFTDDMFRMMNEDGLALMMTRGVWHGNADKWESDEAWVQANIDSTLALLRRYGPNGSYFAEHPEVPYTPLTAIEVFNEPNFGYMIPDKSPIERKVELYTMLQIAEYQAVKAEFPDVRIVGFGAGGASAADMGFVYKCIEKNPEVVQCMDVFSTHPYVDPRPPMTYFDWLPEHSITSAYQNLTRAFAAQGRPDIPFWYTELGWFIPPSLGGRFNSCHGGNDLLEQAAYNVQVYLLGMRLGIERITTMYIMDTDHCNPGFVDYDGTWRPAAHATRTLIDMLPDPRLTGAIYDGEDGQTYAWRFESKVGGDEVIVAFSGLDARTIDIPWNEPTARVTDMLGNTVVVDAVDGKLTLDIGIYPIYIRKPHIPEP